MILNILSTAVFCSSIATTPAYAATMLTSVAANGSNHLAVQGATANMTFDHEAGTAFEAASKGLVATFDGASASRTVVTSGTTPYGADALAPNPYDGNGYFAVGISPSALTLTGAAGKLFSSISFFVGTLDSYNTVDLLDAAGRVIASYDGVAMYDQKGASPPVGDAGVSAINRRVTFTGTNGTTYNGIRFSNAGTAQQAFEFDNVSFTAAVPEPATWAMMLVGFGMVGAVSRYRRRRGTAAIA
jgi:hypothetical protein